MQVVYVIMGECSVKTLSLTLANDASDVRVVQEIIVGDCSVKISPFLSK
jgi:hypothetical protein